MWIGGHTHGFANLAPPTGLSFPGNDADGSAIRLVWDGSNLLPRNTHTVIWKKRYNSGHVGYYADTWHSRNTGTWTGSAYYFGAHGFPCDGAYDGNGQATGGTGSGGAAQYFEIAGLQALDRIAKPGEPAKQVQYGVWYTHARTAHTSGANTIHRFYPDVVNDPTWYIEVQYATSSINSDTGSTPAFYIGASDWRDDHGAGAGRNDETPDGVIRSIKLFNAALSISDIASEAASRSNSPVTAAGIAAVWYINENPTPSDVTDKSGAGHNPSWANAYRPALYTG